MHLLYIVFHFGNHYDNEKGKVSGAHVQYFAALFACCLDRHIDATQAT